jgi:hypothetical protein
MQIDMNNNTAKIISGILTTISMIVIARIVLPAIWFWIGFEISAALLVAIGCAGEWYLHHHPAGRKKVDKMEHHKLESRFIAAVVVGVFMEFFSLGHAIPEAVRLEKDVASAKDSAFTNELQVAVLSNKTVRLSISLEEAKSNNFMLQAKVLELEAKSRWRTITPEQEKAFIELTKNNLKLPIRVRMANGSSAEVQSFSTRIRAVLDKAGFEETNADLAITEWPPELNMLWTGMGPELPPILFVSNPALPGKIIDLRDAQIQLKSYPSYATNSSVTTEFIFVNDDSSPKAYVTDKNGAPILHIKVTDRAPFQITAFTAAQNAFAAIGIPSGNVTMTNIPIGAFEVFVNPK